MTWTLRQSGTTSAIPVAASVSFTSATPTVVTYASHGLVTGQGISFTAATMPTGINSGQTYYASVINSSTFNLTTTPGGGTIGASSTGTTVVAYPEIILGSDDTTNATFVAVVDSSNIVSGDTFEIRVYTKVLSGDQFTLAWKGTFSNVQFVNGKYSPPFASDIAFRTTIKQTAGTGRTFKWKFLTI